MDTARKMRLLRVLEEEGPELYGDFAGLKYRLAPFVARTAQEQERFYEFFDQFLSECTSEANELNALQEAPPVPVSPLPPVRKLSKWWWALLLLPALGLAYWLLQPPTTPDDKAIAADSSAEHIVEKTPDNAGKPYLQSFAIKRDSPRQLLQVNNWYWLLASLPLVVAVWLLARWWKKRHEKTPEKTVANLEAEYPIHDVGPYFVPYLPQDAKITVPRDFFRMAEVMRRRELGARRYFDATASVKATVEAGGYPEWREKSDTRPAEYLFLVQRSNERNQQGQLFERLTAFLKRREAPAEVFFHSGSFDVFKNPEHPQGLNLAELKQHYPAHRLVLLGDGHGLVNPYNPEVPALFSAPVKLLCSWPRRLLLTPESVSGWSFQEALLHRHFLTCPADADGMLAGLEMLDRMEEYEPGNYARREAELLRLHPQPSHRYRHWETPEDHKAYLQDHPEWYRWLCALAVCVQPDWALTIAIGRAIGVEVTHDGLLALSRIPWLNSNAPDTNLRLALLRQLDPADEALARKAVAEELERVQERVAGSFAETDWTTGLAMQRFAIDPHDEGHKTTLRNLTRLGLLSGGQLAELDLIVQEKMDKKGLPARATESIVTWLEQPVPKPLFTRDLIGGLAAMLLSALLLAYGFYYNNTRGAQLFTTGTKAPAVFWASARTLDDKAIELNNQAVELWLNLDTLQTPVSSAYIAEAGMRADSLLTQAIALRTSAGYTLADSNRTALRYNFTAKRFNLVLDASKTDTVELNAIRRDFTEEVRPSAGYVDGSPLRLAALHGSGLCAFYTDRLGEARLAYETIQKQTNNQYFDTLKMQVNLRTLLDGKLLNDKLIESIPKKSDPIPEKKSPITKSKSKSKLNTTVRLPPDTKPVEPQVPQLPQFAKAIKITGLACPEGSFFDRTDGGSCWSCPEGYQRTSSPVDGADACIRNSTTVYAKAINHGRASGKEGKTCDPGQFWDAYEKGTCWSCPDGFSQAQAARITSEQACERIVPEEMTAAIRIPAALCPEGSFRNAADGGSCWSCPPGYIRTIYPINSDQACELRRGK